MLGYETERRLKNFLVAIGDGEALLERARQRLCEIRDFSPESAFQRLDRDGNLYISSFEILNFLRDNRVYTATEAECFRLVKFFDSDEDGRLSLSDFVQMLLPCEDNLLRRIAQERYPLRVGRYDYLPRDSENALTELVERELELLRRLDGLKGDLEVRYDYSTYAAFRAIDRYNEGAINTYNLNVFLKNNGHYASERELLAIIRRIDTDGDAKLNYTEFSDFIRSAEFRPLAEDRRTYSAERAGRNLGASMYGSPLKNSSYDSPARSHSAYGGSRRNFRQSSPLRESAGFRESRMSPLKESMASTLRASSPVRKQPLLRLEEEDELVRALREQIALEKELENAKTALAQRPDFNLYDAFRIFDIDAKGYVNFSDLKAGLNDVGVFPTVEDLELFIKRYDKNEDRRLRFSEFCDAFTPLDAYYANLVNKRTSNDVRGRLYQRDDCFYPETKLEFKSVWRTHFKVESYSESLRQRLYKRPGFNLYEAFISCDLNDDGTISKEELRRLIESRGFYVSEKEVNQLVEKIDKDKDGRISYHEVSRRPMIMMKHFLQLSLS